jgi:hypothetical protein
VTRSLDGDRAAMKMMHPFDLSVRVYGGLVWASRDDHWSNESEIQMRIEEVTHGCPWNFSDVEKLVVSSRNDSKS